VLISSHRKLPLSKAMVVSVAEAMLSCVLGNTALLRGTAALTQATSLFFR
jgi:hypothetical protein